VLYGDVTIFVKPLNLLDFQ